VVDELLGFWRKDAEEYGRSECVSSKAIAFYQRIYRIPKRKLIPVRLVSESVSLRWLEEWLEERKMPRYGEDSGKIVYVEDLLKEAKKQAEVLEK